MVALGLSSERYCIALVDSIRGFPRGQCVAAFSPPALALGKELQAVTVMRLVATA